jgi:hypothetical protein
MIVKSVMKLLAMTPSDNHVFVRFDVGGEPNDKR